MIKSVSTQTIMAPVTSRTFNDTLSQAIADGGTVISSGMSNNHWWAIVTFVERTTEPLLSVQM